MSGESAKKQAEHEVGPADDKQKNQGGQSGQRPETGHEQPQHDKKPGQNPNTGVGGAQQERERNQGTEKGGTGNGAEKHQPGGHTGDESEEERRRQKPEE